MTDSPQNRGVHGEYIADTQHGELQDNWGYIFCRYFDNNDHKYVYAYYLPVRFDAKTPPDTSWPLASSHYLWNKGLLPLSLVVCCRGDGD